VEVPEMNKCDIVLVKAAVFGSTNDRPAVHDHMPLGASASIVKMIHRPKMDGITRNLWRVQYTKAWEGIITGYSFRNTGRVLGGTDYEDPGYLYEDKRHKVIMVQPLYTNRWLKPIACLAEDIVSMQPKANLLKKKSAEILENRELEDHVVCLFCGEVFDVTITPTMIYEEVEARKKCPHCGGKMILGTVVYCSAEEPDEM